MSKQVERLITIAKADIGYLEKATNAKLDDKTANVGSKNYTKYGKWYGDNGVPWCAQAVSYWAAEAGISTTIIPKHESCGVGVRWFKTAGRWHLRNSYIPEPGDIIYYTHNGTSPAHVGIVTTVKGSRVYTIEGNTSGGSTLIDNGGGVAEKNYPLTYSKILGYAHPNYIENVETEIDIMTGEEIYIALNKYLADQKAPDWARKELQEAIDAGITDGTRPMQFIPRYQAAIMAKRAKQG